MLIYTFHSCDVFLELILLIFLAKKCSINHRIMDSEANYGVINRTIILFSLNSVMKNGNTYDSLYKSFFLGYKNN